MRLDDAVDDLVAYHEAGHAVVSHALRQPIIQATIDAHDFDGGASHGHVETAPRDAYTVPAFRSIGRDRFVVNTLHDHHQKLVRERAVISVAGPIAQFRHAPPSSALTPTVIDLVAYGGAGDLELLNQYAEEFGVELSDELMQGAVNRANRLLVKRWGEVWGLAQVLLIQRTLTGTEVRRVIRDHHLTAIR